MVLILFLQILHLRHVMYMYPAMNARVKKVKNEKENHHAQCHRQCTRAGRNCNALPVEGTMETSQDMILYVEAWRLLPLLLA